MSERVFNVDLIFGEWGCVSACLRSYLLLFSSHFQCEVISFPRGLLFALWMFLHFSFHVYSFLLCTSAEVDQVFLREHHSEPQKSLYNEGEMQRLKLTISQDSEDLAWHGIVGSYSLSRICSSMVGLNSWVQMGTIW